VHRKLKPKYIPAFIGAVLAVFASVFNACNTGNTADKSTPIAAKDTSIFIPPDTSTIPNDEFGKMVRYGRDLIVNTAKYVGPDGSAGKYLGNKMNCNNCHLDAGTRPYGLNFFSSHARYPQYRGRENAILTLSERVNNCIERPHNGTPMPLDTKEMTAIVSYMKWLSENVPVGHHVKGDEGMDLEFPDRAADPEKGAVIFANNCASCHGADGQGLWNADSTTYTYPPLWGSYSFQSGSSMHRVLKAARFIKANMPDKLAFWNKPLLTDEQAIDVAAFINDDRIHSRPSKKQNQDNDYPSLNVKPIDYDLGPYKDTFSEQQHKFGPYAPIVKYHKEHGLPVVY
jgi:thiosulfate dehydrogenase